MHGCKDYASYKVTIGYHIAVETTAANPGKCIFYRTIVSLVLPSTFHSHTLFLALPANNIIVRKIQAKFLV